MEHRKYKEITSWFHQYVKSFDAVSDFIKVNHQYKEDHSYEVSKICVTIARSLDLRDEDCLLAEIIGLLHDTGRFAQFVKYQTFKDSISENHAALGVKILKECQVLDSLAPCEQEIIFAAILNHNVFVLPMTQNDRILLFSRIIRDADKLDIYRFILESESYRLNGNGKKVIHLELEEQTTYSESMLQSILHNQCCLYSDLRSIHDFKLLQLSWVFDINFSCTFSLLQQNHYLEKLCTMLPKEEGIQKLADHVLGFVAQKVRGQSQLRIFGE